MSYHDARLIIKEQLLHPICLFLDMFGHLPNDPRYDPDTFIHSILLIFMKPFTIEGRNAMVTGLHGLDLFTATYHGL